MKYIEQKIMELKIAGFHADVYIKKATSDVITIECNHPGTEIREDG